MSMLSEKRKSVSEKLERLMKDREENIKIKLDAYREQLESEPLSEEIINTQTVLSAIDDIIKYENEALSKIEIVENLTVEEAPVEEKPVEIPAEEIIKVEEIPTEEIPAETKIEEAVEIVGEAPIIDEVIAEAEKEEEKQAVEEIAEPAPVIEEKKEEIVEAVPMMEIAEQQAQIEEEKKVEEITENAPEMIAEEPIEIKVEVNQEGKPEIKSEPIEARPGMAYIGVPERR